MNLWMFCCSVAKSCLTLQPHGLQHARLPCPSPFPRVCSNSCPLSWWCHPTIWSSVSRFFSVPFFPHWFEMPSLLCISLPAELPGKLASRVKRLPAIRETLVWFLGRKDPLEKEMATHSSTLAWKIPWTEELGRLQSMGSQRVGHNWATSLHFTSFIFTHTHIIWNPEPGYRTSLSQRTNKHTIISDSAGCRLLGMGKASLWESQNTGAGSPCSSGCCQWSLD